MNTTPCTEKIVMGGEYVTRGDGERPSERVSVLTVTGTGQYPVVVQGQRSHAVYLVTEVGQNYRGSSGLDYRDILPAPRRLPLTGSIPVYQFENGLIAVGDDKLFNFLNGRAAITLPKYKLVARLELDHIVLNVGDGMPGF